MPFRSLIALVAMFAVGASAQEPSCASSLSIGDVIAAMGTDVLGQPVFADGGLRGWRIYKTSNSGQLTALGIGEGSLMTHVCGVPAREIFAKGGSICCHADTSREVEVTFRIAGQEGKISIRRP